MGTLPSSPLQPVDPSDPMATRSFTVSVTADSLSEAMSRAAAMLRTPDVDVLEIVDAGLCVGDTYLVTALLYDRPRESTT